MWSSSGAWCCLAERTRRVLRHGVVTCASSQDFAKSRHSACRARSSFLLQQLPAQRPSLRVAVVTETCPPEVNGVAMTLGRVASGSHARDHHVQLIRPRQGVADAATTRENFEEVLKPGLPIPRYDSLRMGLPARQGLPGSGGPTARRGAGCYRRAAGWSAISAARKLAFLWRRTFTPISTAIVATMASAGWTSRLPPIGAGSTTRRS